ncbi:MAG: carboxypeptidase-like regulatory domain-containing protein, partial [Acidobacteriota bacterium]|nr:carboxypeptidase-like regulatory domain-containing protein [Acidobacteriota bacterium]
MKHQLRFLATALFCVLSFAAVAHAQESVITGQVTTKEDGAPLPGAVVSIPSLNLSATTDQEGRYQLAVPPGVAKGQSVELRVTFSGL